MRFETGLKAREPFDARSILEFLGRRAIAGVEWVTEAEYRRTISLEGVTGVLRVALASRPRGGLTVEADLPDAKDFDRAVARVRQIFDLDVHPRRVAAVLREDPLLGEIVRDFPGLRVPGCWDGFELAVRAILGQQVTVRGAATLGGRLVRAYGERVRSGNGELTHLFPLPESLQDASLDEVGLPRARAETVRALAAAVAAGRVSLEPGGDISKLHRSVTAIRGIGDWTAQYVAMRALKHSDAFPAGDLVLRQVAGEGSLVPSSRELEERSQAWRPWRAYAAIHLWKRAAARPG